MAGRRVAIFVLSLLLAAAIGPAQTGSGGSTSIESAVPAGLIDVNRATVAELKTLPGIHEAYANAILRNRPYKNKAQILSRKVIPRAAYLKIKDLIIAKQ